MEYCSDRVPPAKKPADRKVKHVMGTKLHHVVVNLQWGRGYTAVAGVGLEVQAGEGEGRNPSS